MKILCNNFIPFRARNKEARKADDIQRRTRASFPMISSTYAADFYSVFNKDINDIDPDSKMLFRILESKIKQARSDAQIIGLLSGASVYNENYKIVLNQVLKHKVGNCEENAKAALSVLFANGFYNSSRVGLEYEIKFIDKQTGEPAYSISKDLNHSFAITDLNTCKKQDIIIDPWLGFADNKQGACARFKGIYKKDLDEFENEAKEKFYGLFHLKEGFKLEDYEIRREFIFPMRERMSATQKQEIGEYVKNVYPETVLDIIA